MKYNYFYFLLYIWLNLLVIISSTKREKENFRENPMNPYLILGVPPWAKFANIKKKYKKLLSHENDIIRLQLIKQAYNKLEMEYKNNKKKDKTFYEVLGATIKRIFIYEFMMLGIIIITWLIYKFTSFFSWLVVAFVIIDNLIPHLFDTMFSQYIFSLIFGIVLYFLKNNFCQKKNKNKEENTDGTQRRKRFEKVE